LTRERVVTGPCELAGVSVVEFGRALCTWTYSLPGLPRERVAWVSRARELDGPSTGLGASPVVRQRFEIRFSGRFERAKDRAMIHLSASEREIVGLVARYVDSEVRPVVRELEQEDTYPEKIIDQMKEMGVYGMCIPEPYGEFGVSTPCFVLGPR
jgi:hypothetical protein